MHELPKWLTSLKSQYSTVLPSITATEIYSESEQPISQRTLLFWHFASIWGGGHAVA
jgi:hypothetical protein